MLKLDTLANGGQPSSIGASAAGNGNLLLGPGTLRYTGPTAVIDRGYTLQAGSGRAAVLDIDNNLTIAARSREPRAASSRQARARST
jgi:fibronectin-binding autotransporter adhesin